MTPLGNTRDHYWLAKRMAKATGTDLVRAWDEGFLTEEDWMNMIQSCRGCAWAGRCPRWMDNLENEGADAPDRCVNHERLQALKAALSEAV